MALGRCHMVSAVRAGLSRLPFVVLLVLAIMALSFVFMMLCRYEQNRRNAGGAGSPQSSAVAYGEELPATGRFTKSITYTCIDAPGRETVSPVVWDDGWFFGDMRTYNHDLAKASSVLAALGIPNLLITKKAIKRRRIWRTPWPSWASTRFPQPRTSIVAR